MTTGEKDTRVSIAVILMTVLKISLYYKKFTF